ncbi:acyl carrier protein [Jiangella alkaliphila]|uniref:Acyl carrier protein n=1 Tax=Jiangella alkaliphila TaxID=419479 RepID=A0A1H2J1K1_9ACTN|nr:acyl carrier protein [Jiangella alkaliphila]SDU50303.1 acyl carrier protein [Jiangella alkaliphila]
MSDTLDTLRAVLIAALDLPQRPEDLQVETALFGSLPELDSLGVLQLVSAIEERFDITIDDEEFDADLFETLGSLTAFVDSKLAAA